jgi:histidinol-phosphate aminotransferase
MSALALRPVLTSTARYAPPRHPAPCDLDLAATELPPLDADQLSADLAAAACDGYPSTAALQEKLARTHGVEASQVLVTAGSDDALERACRIVLEPGRAALVTAPTFEMLPRWIRLTGAACREVAWPREGFPLTELERAIDEATTLIAVVTPNNPTGSVAGADALATLATRAPHALMLVDLAYIEFADVDPTTSLLQLPNVVVTRTLSKAWGLPALRLGYALGNESVIAAMQRVAPPYPASTPSIAAALRALPRDRDAMRERVSMVRTVRGELTAALDRARLGPFTSQANFVATTDSRATWLRDGLAGLGIAVRTLDGRDGPCIRITCPTGQADTQRLLAAIATVTEPEALLFDLDGVLADVSESYRTAILNTAARFGATLTARDVQDRKAAGNANDDWALTHELLASRGIDAELSQVTATFESLYQGSGAEIGLRSRERLIPTASWLRELAARLPLAIVTGRPRLDAERFLREQGIAECFHVVVCREDAAIKPDPAPVLRALALLGVTRAWMIGDTPDDIRAARAAGVVPIGIPAPGESSQAAAALGRAGSARVITTLEELLPCLP